MISPSEVILYKKKGFDGEKYLVAQKEAILKKLSQFEKGRLYLEIGGKFLYDAHAARVLPGFIPETKKYIFSQLKDQIEILFCIHAADILQDTDTGEYLSHVQHTLRRIELELGVKPHLVINTIDIHSNIDKILEFEQYFQRKNYRTWERYKISGYPSISNTVLSDDGFGNDDHIPLTKKLILVVSSSSGTGKTSTCLGQIYNDLQLGIQSGYATFHLFPVADLSSQHPINLAYKAARIDVEDGLVCDTSSLLLEEAVVSTKYMESFRSLSPLVSGLFSLGPDSFGYHSVHDINLSTLSSCIIHDDICCLASLDEIKRRKIWLQQKSSDTISSEELSLFDSLLAFSEEYMHSRGYTLDQKLS